MYVCMYVCMYIYIKDLINIINNVKFKNNKNNFQKKLRADINEIKNSRNICVFADKTNNVYRMPISEHDELLKENVIKTYKKSSGKVTKINQLGSEIHNN